MKKILSKIKKLFNIRSKEYVIKYSLRDRDTGEFLHVIDDYSDNDLEFGEITYIDMYDSTERLERALKHFYWYDNLEIIKLKIEVTTVK